MVAGKEQPRKKKGTAPGTSGTSTEEPSAPHSKTVAGKPSTDLLKSDTQIYIIERRMEQLQAYNDVIAYLKKKGRPHHLLIGNGFSIAYDKDIFSYNALNDYIMKSDNELTKQVFQVYNTKNFETIMEQLNNMVSVLKLLGAPEILCKQVDEVSQDLKNKLIVSGHFRPYCVP